MFSLQHVCLQRQPWLLLWATLCASCHQEHTAPNVPQPPPGEIWLSDAQLQRLDLRVEPVQIRAISDELRAAARVAFDEARVSHVFSPVSGRVTHIDAQLGQYVKRGQKLAVIQSSDIGTATSDLRKAEADARAAQIDQARQQHLVAEGAASVHDLQEAQARARQATAELERARARVRLLGGKGRGVAQTYVVRSEIDGYVVARFVTPGMEVQGLLAGGSPKELFTVGNIERVWVVADIFEMDLGRIHTGSHIEVRAVAFPERPFSGVIDWISETLDPITRTARVRVVLENEDPEHRLRPDMLVTATIKTEPQRLPAVPRDSVVRIDNYEYVFREAGPTPDGRTRFERVHVEIDAAVGVAFHPVQRGLRPGHRIATRNVIQLVGML